MMITTDTTTELFNRDGQRFTGKPTTNDNGALGYFPGSRACPRCGGAGGADKWKFTGWKCFECGGAGKVPSERFIKLYDAAKLAKLNVAQAKRDATRAAKAAAAAKAEAERVEREHEGIKAAHAPILARMAPWAESSTFLADMAAQVITRARPLSAGQLEAAERACAKFEAEAARRAAARHVGEVGAKLTLNLTYVRSVDLTQSKWDPLFIIWTFRTEDGSTVVYKGGWPKAFDGLEMETVGEGPDSYRRPKAGGAIALTATIKAHDANRRTGEPETIIMRPKAA